MCTQMTGNFLPFTIHPIQKFSCSRSFSFIATCLCIISITIFNFGFGMEFGVVTLVVTLCGTDDTILPPCRAFPPVAGKSRWKQTPLVS